MGNRRLGRKRLYTIEKQGQTVDLGAGAGASPMIARTTQHRLGQELITEIVIDLGTSKGTIVDSGVGEPLGVASAKATLGQLTRAKVGIVTEIRAIMTEVPTGGVADIDLIYGDDSVNTDAAPTNSASILAGLTAVGEDISTAYDANEVEDKYLYVASGLAGGPTAYTAGKLIIYIYGYAVADDL